MAIKRKSETDFDYAAAQLLAYLAVEGYMDGVAIPDWAYGSSVGEMIETLQYLGDAQWLSDASGSGSPQDDADTWFYRWCVGREVMSHEEAKEEARNLPQEEDD